MRGGFLTSVSVASDSFMGGLADTDAKMEHTLIYSATTVEKATV